MCQKAYLNVSMLKTTTCPELVAAASHWPSELVLMSIMTAFANLDCKVSEGTWKVCTNSRLLVLTTWNQTLKKSLYVQSWQVVNKRSDCKMNRRIHATASKKNSSYAWGKKRFTYRNWQLWTSKEKTPWVNTKYHTVGGSQNRWEFLLTYLHHLTMRDTIVCEIML